MFMLRKLYPPISLCWWANIAFGKIYIYVCLFTGSQIIQVKLFIGNHQLKKRFLLFP